MTIDQHANPNPIYQWIDHDLDNRMVGVRIAAFIDHVKIFAQCGVVRHDMDWLSAAGFKETLFRVKPGQEFSIFINFQQRCLRL